MQKPPLNVGVPDISISISPVKHPVSTHMKCFLRDLILVFKCVSPDVLVHYSVILKYNQCEKRVHTEQSRLKNYTSNPGMM